MQTQEPQKQKPQEYWRKWITYYPTVSFVSGTVGYIAVGYWKEWFPQNCLEGGW